MMVPGGDTYHGNGYKQQKRCDGRRHHNQQPVFPDPGNVCASFTGENTTRNPAATGI